MENQKENQKKLKDEKILNTNDQKIRSPFLSMGAMAVGATSAIILMSAIAGLEAATNVKIMDFNLNSTLENTALGAILGHSTKVVIDSSKSLIDSGKSLKKSTKNFMVLVKQLHTAIKAENQKNDSKITTRVLVKDLHEAIKETVQAKKAGCK